MREPRLVARIPRVASLESMSTPSRSGCPSAVASTLMVGWIADPLCYRNEPYHAILLDFGVRSSGFAAAGGVQNKVSARRRAACAGGT